MTKPSCALALLLALDASAATASPVVVAEQRFALVENQAVALHLRSGTVAVEASRSSVELTARLEVRCTVPSDCEAARHLALTSKSRAEDLDLSVDGLPRLGGSAQAVLTVHLPADRGLEIDLGAGEVRISGHRGMLEVDVGSGDVSITADRAAVALLQLDSGLGNVEVHLGGETLHGAGLLFGSELRWSQPSGSAQIEVDCGVGDVVVELR